MKFLSFSLIVLLVSCSEPDKKLFVERNDAGIIKKGYVISDSLLDDTVYYYDIHNHLIRKEVYKVGKLDGLSIDFHRTGCIEKVTNYSNGLKNGYNLYFDSVGKRVYQDYYYYDLIVGPITYYDKKENPKRFFFVNLQNETLVDIDYSNWAGVESILPQCVNYVYDLQKNDSIIQGSLLLYIISPPRISFKYSIVKKYEGNNGEDEILKIEKELPFVNLTLPRLDSPKEYYSIKLSVYDSIFKKATVLYKEVF